MLSLDINKPIHLGETGWASTANYLYGEAGSGAADEYKEKAYYDAMRAWSNEFGASLFFFQAIDEPWKGDATNPGDSEKHFGLINIDCEVKYVLWDLVDAGAFDGLTRDCGVEGFTKTEGGNEQAILDSILQIPLKPVTGEPTEGEFVVLGDALYSGAAANGWEQTAWAGVNDDTAVLTIATDPATAKDWGWGAAIDVAGKTEDMSNYTKLTFEIRGVASAESVFPTYQFSVGYQTDFGEWGTNVNVRMNTAGKMLTEEFVKYTVNLADLTSYNASQLSKVKQTFIVFDQQGSPVTKSSIEVRNISWLE
ncbi:hypothetical protein [Psychromonas sp. MME2]